MFLRSAVSVIQGICIDYVGRSNNNELQLHTLSDTKTKNIGRDITSKFTTKIDT